jgi:calcineurin-like phosphoesterase family protein
MSGVYFIGDLHFGHKAVAKWRPFDSSEEHDAHLIRQWNEIIKPKDVVWILGDVAFRTNLQYVKDMLRSVRGQKRVVLGNHDDPEMLREAGLKYQFGMVKKYGFWLTHAPIHPAELRGSPNIHGHVHSATIPDDRYLNVSAENINYTPISLEVVREIFKERE